MVRQLRDKDIQVIVVKDTIVPHTPIPFSQTTGYRFTKVEM